jgi:uncharacterized protein (DUF697 family)/tellurite resistance protein
LDLRFSGKYSINSINTTRKNSLRSKLMDSKEALASLQLLVAVAKANGVIAEEERDAIKDALADSKLPGEYTVDSLLAENLQLDTILAVLQSEEARHQSFSAAYLLAHADGDCDPDEKAVLDKLQNTWNISESEVDNLQNVLKISQGSVASSLGAPGKAARIEESNDVIKLHRVLAALAGAVPVPLVGDVMVLSLQMKMVVELGRLYGQEMNKTSIKALLGTLGVGTGARMAVSSLAKLVPGFGSVVGAVAGYATTHAVGQVAIKYFESNGTLSAEAMKGIFKEKKAEGEKEYQTNKASLDANKEAADKLTELGKQLKAGAITQEQYNEEIAKLDVKA